MESILAALNRRQEAVDPDNLPDGWVIDDDGVARPWWYSREGYIVKWSIFFGLFFLIGLYLLVGYLHAKARVRKGRPPLYYHRWFVSRAERASVDPHYAYPQAGYYPYQPPPPQYQMYPVAPPPVYEPPAGSSKADPSQQYWPRPGDVGTGAAAPVAQADFPPPHGPPTGR
ncbi:hypothetical protein jhhlp_004573 [Lomentospora prolificans]|uniref:Uncharacterized protein n=1 Tax=Lomentospora prolificans TaxID=41688 RepID=A0A2N3NBY6_9PEZI|nr:hypothetical protein jhhlp_004573 [Lomentospora prolificans]